VELEPQTQVVAPAEAIEQLTEALERGRRLLARLSGARRADLTEGLHELTEAVAAALLALSGDENPSDENLPDEKPPRRTPNSWHNRPRWRSNPATTDCWQLRLTT
jgi:hypothetical protein